jgi:membrane glycosyltransferase
MATRSTVYDRLASFKSAVGGAVDHARVAAALPRRPMPSAARAAAELPRVERALREGPDALTADERLRLLSSRTALAQMRAEVVAHRAHPGWWLAPEPVHAADSVAPVRELEGELAESL